MIDYYLLEHYVSKPRMNRYYTACNNQQNSAITLYHRNLLLSQAFLPLLTILEVAVRNSVSHVLELYFSDPDWISNQKNGFMVHPSLSYIDKRTGIAKTNTFLKTEVEKSERRLIHRGEQVTAGKIIAEQTFGFWKDLFETHHYRILQGVPIKVFRNLPAGHGRKEVCDALNNVRLFRNRIYHNEPVCFSGMTINFAQAAFMHKAIVDLLNWMNTDLCSWAGSIDTVAQVIANCHTPL